MRIALLLLLAAAAAAKDIPSWISEAAAKPAGKYPAKVLEEVLLSEEKLTVSPDGRRSMTERHAVRILQPSRKMPEAFRTYNTKNGRIRDFRAWLIRWHGWIGLGTLVLLPTHVIVGRIIIRRLHNRKIQQRGGT